MRRLPLVIIATSVAASALVATGHGVATSSTLATAQIAPQVAAPGTGNWSSLGTGVDNWVNALAKMDDTLFVAGRLNTAGGLPTGKIAAWHGGSWSNLAGGVTNASDTEIDALAVLDDTLFVGGVFTGAGGTSGINRVAAWSRGAWTGLGAGIDDSGVLSLEVQDDSLYVGGDFSAASGEAGTSGFAVWSGSTWTGYDGGMLPGDASIAAMTVNAAGNLTVGGRFDRMGAGINDDTNVATWEASTQTWMPLGEGAWNPSSNVPVYELASRDDTVIAGGNFTQAGTVTTTGIASWDGSSWSALGGGLSVDCGTGAFVVSQALTYDSAHDLLYVGGNFCQAGASTVNLLAAWDFGVGDWITFVDDTGTVGLATGGRVQAFALDGSSVYVGGTFTNAGGLANADHIARWTWNPPNGTNSLVGASGEVVTLTGSQFIGVPAAGGVYFGGAPSPSYVRDDTTSFSSVVIPAGISGTVPVEVDAVGGRAQVGTLTVPGPPPPPTPASAPREVVAVAGDASASVSWVAPSSSGSFTVSTYQAVASPGGRTCLVAAPALSCEVAGLSNGTPYTFTVRALTGAGWSPASEPSNEVTPEAAPRPSVVITGSREGKRIEVSGETTGFGMGGTLRPWLRFPGQSEYSEGAATILVSMDGTFEWGRKTGKRVSVYVQTPDGSVRSNVVTIQVR